MKISAIIILAILLTAILFSGCVLPAPAAKPRAELPPTPPPHITIRNVSVDKADPQNIYLLVNFTNDGGTGSQRAEILVERGDQALYDREFPVSLGPGQTTTVRQAVPNIYESYTYRVTVRIGDSQVSQLMTI